MSKGSLLDTLPILAGVFAFAVVSLFVIYLLTTISPAFNDPSIPAEATTTFNTLNGKAPGILDNLGAIMAIGLPLIAAGLAYLLNSSAIFFWLLTGFSFIFVVAGGAISYLWEKLTGVGAPLAGAAAQLPIMSWTMENYAIYALFVVILLLGAIFMRMRTQGGSVDGI